MTDDVIEISASSEVDLTSLPVEILNCKYFICLHVCFYICVIDCLNVDYLRALGGGG